MSPEIIPLIFLTVGLLVTVAIIVRKALSPKKLGQISSLINQGKYSAAIKAAKILTTKEPNNSAAHYLLGKAYLADNKPELALMELKTVNQLGDFSENCPEIFSLFQVVPS